MRPTINTRLRLLRAERGWPQAKLAAPVGVTRQTINSAEKGSSATVRARLMAWPSHRWRREHLPVIRRGRILPRSWTYGAGISACLSSMK